MATPTQGFPADSAQQKASLPVRNRSALGLPSASPLLALKTVALALARVTQHDPNLPTLSGTNNNNNTQPCVIQSRLTESDNASQGLPDPQKDSALALIQFLEHQVGNEGIIRLVKAPDGLHRSAICRCALVMAFWGLNFSRIRRKPSVATPCREPPH